MSAPNLTFTTSGVKLSNKAGFDKIVVEFTADAAYKKFECRATKIDEEYGLGKGALVASFSTTPANTKRTFEVYDDFLLRGDGQYRISLFAQGEDGSWNDNHGFITSDKQTFYANGVKFLCMRG